MQTDTKIVEFEKYCKDCKHLTKNESEDPCYECLQTPSRLYSRKPINFEKK